MMRGLVYPYERSQHTDQGQQFPRLTYIYLPKANRRMKALHLHYPKGAFYFVHKNKKLPFAARSIHQRQRNKRRRTLPQALEVCPGFHTYGFLLSGKQGKTIFLLSFLHPAAADNLGLPALKSTGNYRGLHRIIYTTARLPFHNPL